jgi:hypothetical protein
MAIMADTTNYNVISTTSSRIPVSQAVSYSCEFVNLWTRERHPRLYPGNAAHWSPMVLTAHDASYEMWSAGNLASSGVEEVAEVGLLLLSGKREFYTLVRTNRNRVSLSSYRLARPELC